MGDISYATLYNIFAGTLSSDRATRAGAEQALAELSTAHSDLVLQLMRFACEPLPEVDSEVALAHHRHVILAAAIRMRNVVGRSDWNRKPYFTEVVKAQVRQLIVPLQCLPHVTEHVRRQLLAATGDLINYDYPQRWGGLIVMLNHLMDEWLHALQGAMVGGTRDQVVSSLRQLKGGLAVLRCCCKVYDDPLRSDAADVDRFAAMFIPSFVSLCEQFHGLWQQELQQALQREQQMASMPLEGADAVNALLTVSPLLSEVSHSMRLILKCQWSFLANRWPKFLCQAEDFERFWTACLAQPMFAAQSYLLPLCELRLQRHARRAPSAHIALGDHFAVFQESAAWRLLKWCYTVTLKMTQEFISPKSCERRARGVAALFKETYMATGVKAALHLVRWHSQPPALLLSSKAYIMCLEILTAAVADKTIYTSVLYPAAEELMTTLLFPRLAFSSEDAELWQANPEEYVRRQTSPTGDLFSAKVVASSLLLSLAVPEFKHQDPNLLHALVNFLMNQLQIYSEMAAQAVDEKSSPPHVMEAARRVDAALYCMCQFKKVLTGMELGDDKLETVLTCYVVPATRFPLCFLRARAVLVLSVFAPSIQWSTPQAYQHALQAVLPLLNDTEIPVRVQTCTSFSRLTRHPYARDIVTPCIAELIHHYFQVMRLMDNEAVVRTLRKTITYYHETLSQWGLTLTDMIVEHFHTVMQTVTSKYATLESITDGELCVGDCLEDDGFADTLMAADELLETLTTLVKALPDTSATRDSPSEVLEADVFIQMQYRTGPVLFTILSHQGGGSYGFMDPALNLFATLVSRSPALVAPMWQLLFCLRQLVLGGAVDYFGQMLAPLDNMVSVSPFSFLFAPMGSLCEVPSGVAKDVQALTPMQVVDSMCAAVLQSTSLRAREVAAVPKVYDSMLQNYWMLATPSTKPDALLSAEPIVKTVAQRILYTAGLRPKQNNTLCVLFANTILSCMLADAATTVQTLAGLDAICSFYQQYVYLTSQRDVAAQLRTYDRSLFVLSFSLAAGQLFSGAASGSWSEAHDALQDALCGVVESMLLVAFATVERKCCETEIAFHERRLRKKRNVKQKQQAGSGTAEDVSSDDGEEWLDTDSCDTGDCVDSSDEDASDVEDWEDEVSDDLEGTECDAVDSEIRAVAQQAAQMREKVGADGTLKEEGFDDDDDDDNLLDEEDDDFSSPVDAVNVWAVMEHDLLGHPQATTLRIVTLLQHQNAAHANIFAEVKSAKERLMAVRAEVADL